MAASWLGSRRAFCSNAKRAPWALERQVRLVAGLLVLLGLALPHFWPVAIALAKLPWNRRSAPTCPLTETRP